VHITIDDFGTGFSSLSRLRRLPISRLKLDGSFVRGIPHDVDDRSMARAIISMAHSLRMRVIAEGVETQAHLEFLKGLACDEMQGFYFSKPVSAEAIAGMLAGKKLSLDKPGSG